MYAIELVHVGHMVFVVGVEHAPCTCEVIDLFSLSSFAVDTRTGVLLLEDCISLCMSNTSCLSINYETGLCVLFSSSAELSPGKENRSTGWAKGNAAPLFLSYLASNQKMS